ncbi:unnamed protein product [Lepeophtheirus salmonis]|uniref:(salmon louse) hypothetical protein n=1 Tax=Lepeophtheirus salmonis TaxID=72036 RepID=A0A7R8CRD8_LEPSM|nr:unnamed protein product [Lepeophtheirus salmonis]CAF2902603.1 unnamed protein product [Lepeophtheirus salmonis]
MKQLSYNDLFLHPRTVESLSRDTTKKKERKNQSTQHTHGHTIEEEKHNYISLPLILCESQRVQKRSELYNYNLERSLESLKESTANRPSQLTNLNYRILDSNKELKNFCRLLELVTQHGLLNLHFFQVVQSISNKKRSSQVMKGCYKDFNLCRSVDLVNRNKGVNSFTGKTRLLLRTSLKNKCLGQLLYLIHEYSLEYYSPESILNDTEDYDLLMKTIKNSESHLIFHLIWIYRTRLFLDQTWFMPYYIIYELVPCRDLGLLIHVVKGRSIVVEVHKGSVAGEDGKVEVGDVIESVNGIPTIDLSSYEVATLIKKQSNGGRRPHVIGVIKGRADYKGTIYSPLIPLWEETGLKTDDEEFGLLNGSCNHLSGFKIEYLGSVKVGSTGDTSILDSAIDRVQSQELKNENRATHPVKLVLGELGLRMYCEKTGTCVLNYNYPEVSSCGQGQRSPRVSCFLYWKYLLFTSK